MLKDILSIGDKIDIIQTDNMGKPLSNVKSYVSQLVDIVSSDVIHILTPIGGGRLILLLIGERYNLCFYTNKGLFQCNCEAIKNYRDNNMVIAQVRLTTDLEKIQRRQYFRLECIQDIEYRKLSREEEMLGHKMKAGDFVNQQEKEECQNKLDEYNLEWSFGVMTDISGGGARFNSETQYEAGDLIYLKLDFINNAEHQSMRIGAEVISSIKLLNRIGRYEHRIKFKGIDKKDRELLIKYIFEQERRKRRNEKGMI